MDIGKSLSLGVNGGLGLVVGVLLRYSRSKWITINHPIIYRISSTSTSTTIVTGKRTCISTGIYRNFLTLTFHVSHVLTLSLNSGLSLVISVLLRHGRPKVSCHHSLVYNNLSTVLGLIAIITGKFLTVFTMIYDLLLTLTFKVSLLLGVSLKIGLSLIVSILLRDNREVLTSGYNISIRLTDMELIAIVSSDCLLHPNVIVDVSLTIATLVGDSLTLRLHSVLRQLIGGIL